MTELYHLGIDRDEVPPAAVLVEHGLTGEALRALLEGSEDEGGKREFRSWSGTFEGHPVLVVEAGFGAPSTVIALEELVRAGARKVVWLGQRRDPRRASAEVLVPTGAIRSDGTSPQYAPLAYPALPDFAMSSVLREALATPAMQLVESIDVVDDEPEVAQDLCSAALFVVGAARGAAVASVLLAEAVPGVEALVARAVLRSVTEGPAT